MVKQTALMDLPEEIFENVLRKLTGHDTETFIALRSSSKRLGFLVDKVLVTPDGSNIDALRRRKLLHREWNEGGWSDLVAMKEEAVSQLTLAGTDKKIMFASLDFAAYYDAEHKPLSVVRMRSVIATSSHNPLTTHLVDMLSRIGDVRCLYVNIGDQNLEPDQWTSFLLGSRLAKLRLEELVFPLYSAVRVTLGGMIKHQIWDGLTKLDFSVPEILKEFSPQEDAVFGKLLRLLPNLISFAARNLPIGIQTWKALADSCRGSITHIDVTGCIGVGAACVGEEQGQYLTALARMSKLKGLLMGGTQLAGFFMDLWSNTAAKRVVANLHTLDISEPEMEGASPSELLDTVATLLHTAVSLRSFSALGLKSVAGSELQLQEQLGQAGLLGAVGGDEVAELSSASQPTLECSLHHLTVGWGFNSGLLRAAIGGSEFLTSLTIGLGAQINDADLETVSLLCPHLQRLVLRFAMVSETGVGKVVRASRSLTVLQLLRCSGPFGDDLGAAFASRRPLLLLKELRIVGGAQHLTDQGLAACLSRSVAQLHALELARCSSITPDAASSIQLHADTLEHLVLVYCDIFSSARGIEALHMVTACSELRTLTLRHCATPASTFRLPELKACRLLRHISLDACDMDHSPLKAFRIAWLRLWNDALRFVEVHSCGTPMAGVAGKSSLFGEDPVGSCHNTLERYDLATGQLHRWDWKSQTWVVSACLSQDLRSSI